MMELDEFLAATTWPHNSYVSFPGMKSLYVRRGSYRIDAEIVADTIQIGSVEARMPGNGAFRRLIDYLASEHPTRTIVVECVLSDLLADILTGMEFRPINPTTGRHFARSGCP